MSIHPGVYVIRNVAGGTVIDLRDGNSNNGASIQGWHQLAWDDSSAYDQFWFIAPVPGKNAYTLYNLKGGTVMELRDGNPSNGTTADGWASITDPNDPARLHQQWFIEPATTNTYSFINVQTTTALDLSNGGSGDGTKIQGWESQQGNANQQWYLERHVSPNIKA